jgi:hypothetical protein
MQNRSTLDALVTEVCHWVCRSGWVKVTGTVRPSTVVVAKVLSEHYPQMPLTEDQHVVGEFSSDGADEPFGETVRSRAAGRNPNLWGLKTRCGVLTCAPRVLHGHGSSSDADAVDASICVKIVAHRPGPGRPGGGLHARGHGVPPAHLRADRSRARFPPGTPARSDSASDRCVDHSSRPQPDDGSQRPSHYRDVPAPGSGFPVHRSVRRSLHRGGHPDSHQSTPSAERMRSANE